MQKYKRPIFLKKSNNDKMFSITIDEKTDIGASLLSTKMLNLNKIHKLIKQYPFFLKKVTY